MGWKVSKVSQTAKIVVTTASAVGVSAFGQQNDNEKKLNEKEQCYTSYTVCEG